MQNDDVEQLAIDLDKAPTGEDVIERIIHEVVTLQLAHNQTTAKVERLEAQNALLTKLVDSHQVDIEDLKMRRQTGGIVQ